jgi:hypothetical protein
MTWELQASTDDEIVYRYDGDQNARVGAYKSNQDNGTWYLLTHQDDAPDGPHNYPITHSDYMSRADAIKHLNLFVSTRQSTPFEWYDEDEFGWNGH